MVGTTFLVTSTAIMSFKIKLAIFATFMVAAVALSLSVIMLRFQTKTYVEQQEDYREGRVQSFSQVAREAILMNDDTDMINYVGLFKRSPDIDYAMVLTPEGKIIVHTDPLLINKILDDESSKKALAYRARQTPLPQKLTQADGKEVIDLSLPIMIGINPAEFRGVVRIGFDKKNSDLVLEEKLKEARRQIGSALAISLLLGIVLAFFLAWILTRTIDTLKKGARTIGEGKLSHRINVNTKDELQELASEFNLMAEKLGELDRMKQDFVSNVTHELRSPITSIRGYLDLLLKGDGGPVTDLQRDYLSIIKNSAVRLGRFIDNLLDVAKIEAQKLKLTPEPLTLFDLAHEMDVLFKPQAEDKRIKIVNAVPKNSPQGFVDKDKLAEVLINLTSNAIKFTPEGGEVKIGLKEYPSYLEMFVQDSGVGIPKDMIGKLFNKFEQVKTTKGLARQQKGTGLGLTIAKGIIEAHGGKIWIESPSPSGQGTVFYFTIPKLTEELKTKLQI